MNHISSLLDQYGYVVLFVALALELIAFPTPGETLMTYCGFLSFQGKLNWALSILTASLGIITGITVSYIIGKVLGKPFFDRYGHKIHMGPEKLQKTSNWFGKYGNGLLIVSYFIPGIRHITGYFAGISKIPYKKFALNAYIGAFVWSGTFISLGKVLGANWEKYHAPIKKYMIIAGVTLGIVLILVYLYKTFNVTLKAFALEALKNSIKIFHSFGKIRLVMVGFAIALLSLTVLVFGLIQDFLANEFQQFDEITSMTLLSIVPQQNTGMLSLLVNLASYKVLIPVAIILFVWIIIRGKNKFLEIRFLLIAMLGAEIMEEILRKVFHLLRPYSFTFPSEQTLVAVVIYGFGAFIIFRHIKRSWMGTATVFLSIVLCFLSGLSIIYLGRQKPSDIVAGYVFGSLFLCIVIVLMEIYRILPTISKDSKV